MPGAGRLRSKVRFERRGAASNVGGVVRAASWTPLFDPVRAEVRPVRGGEAVQAARLSGVEVFEVTVRGSAAAAAVDQGDRIVEILTAGGVDTVVRSLAIKARANPDRRGAWLTFLCEQDSAQDRGAAA